MYIYMYIFTYGCSIHFKSHLFSSPIGARTLGIPVPYSPPSVGAYSRTPSRQPTVRVQIISLRSDGLVVPKIPACGCE